ncbi:hypothetical protein ACFE04_017626 [Oxalis oulophora]
MALLTSTTSSTTVYNKDFVTSSVTKIYNGSTLFYTKQVTPRRFQLHIISCTSTSSSSADGSAAVEQAESSIETPKVPRSLISTLNVERALRGIPITDIDYYGVLGLTRRCSPKEVDVAYKSKVEQLLSRGLEEEELDKEMEVLKESYSVLSSDKERRLYDWSLVRSEEPDRYAWPSEVDRIKLSPEDPPPDEPEDVGPTKLVTYFFFGWFVIAFILSSVLNRS